MFLLILLIAVSLVQGFYLPGTTPVDFIPGESVVKLKVNKLTSAHNPLPFRYYFAPYCAPPGKLVADHENLGEILRGDRIVRASNYFITAGVDIQCAVVHGCRGGANDTFYDAKALKRWNKLVDQEYRVHWIIDNLEGAIPRILDAGKVTKRVYEIGFPVGFAGGPAYPGSTAGVNYLNNHVSMVLQYHTNDYLDDNGKSTFRIVGFEFHPTSIAYLDSDWEEWARLQPSNPEPSAFSPKGCEFNPSNLHPQPLDGAGQKIIFTYSVHWEKSEKLWSNRWDPYFVNADPEIHWFSIINSFMIVLFLSGMVGMIMMRTLSADFIQYNRQDEEIEETGWKLVHGDVFRTPGYPRLLSIFVGVGAHLLAMVVITLVFALLGFLSPANRGGMGTAIIATYVVMSVVSGYFSVRLYKLFKGTDWKSIALYSGIFLPGISYSTGFVVNFFIWGSHSSGAVPFTTMLALLALWLLVSLPLCYVGGYFANKKPVQDPPVGTNQIPRQIPPRIWYLHPVVSVILGGILPFGAVFIELFFVLSAIWGNQYYYIFGFLFLVFIILIITSAEITVVMCYFQLCSEDYEWWWRSFFTSGASAFYLFAYAISYYVTKMEVPGFVPALLYTSYTALMSLVFFLLTGCVGFYSCFFFVRKIFSSIHVD